MPTRCRSQARGGLTLVELLAVIAIVAILIGLALPAIQSARESARFMQCRANVRQLALACRSYLNAHECLPPPGSGFGDPNVVSPPPGGWLYHILPFVEQQPLFNLGLGKSGDPWKADMRTRVGTAVPVYTCPNRGSAVFTAPPEVAWQTVYPGISYPFAPVQLLTRSDYAGCWSGINASGPLGPHLANANRGNLVASIFDGQANVFLCGERYLRTNEYRPDPFSTPADWVLKRRECNNKGWSIGSEGDVYATVISGTVPQPPLPDSSSIADCGIVLVNGDPDTTLDSRRAGRFGSPHSGLPMAMVDGSVRVVAFDIDPAVFNDLGQMANGRGAVEQLQ